MVDDPDLPFIVSQSEVRIKPLSYTRLPVRVVPITPQDFSSSLRAQSADGEHHLSIKLVCRAVMAVV